jgi:sulfonate transport system substrate-binding protein
MRSFYHIASTVLLSALVLLSQISRAETAPPAIRIAVVGNATSGKLGFVGAPQIIANDPIFKAELAKRHITVQWVPVSTAAVATLINEAFTNKQVDFAYYGDLPSVILNASGISTRLIVPGGVGNNVYLVVPPNSPVHSINDLKGKRISLNRGRPWEATFERLLATNHLTYKDFSIINLNPQAGAAALASGSVDAYFTTSDAYPLVDKGLGKIIWSTQDLPNDWKYRAELWGTTDYIQKYPEATQLLADAYVRALYWTSQEKNQQAYIQAQTLDGQSTTVVQRENQNKLGSWKQNFSPLFTPALASHYQQIVNFALSNHLIRKNVDVNQLLDGQFVPVALRNQHLENYWTLK